MADAGEVEFREGVEFCGGKFEAFLARAEDRLDFAMVTIASAHLQQLLHDFSDEFLEENVRAHNGCSVLLLTEATMTEIPEAKPEARPEPAMDF